MNPQAGLREELHKMIEQIKDVSILQAVYIILEREKQYEEEKEEDFYDSLHPLLQASIDRGLEQINKGHTIPHEDVRKRYAKWLRFQ